MLRKKRLYQSFFMLLFIIMLIAFNYCYASDWWGSAWNFYEAGKSVTGSKPTAALGSIEDLLEVVGNMVFVIITVVLGVKYIWGGAESKSKVSDSLMTLIVAAIFFYGWTTIKSLFVTGNDLMFVENNYESTARNIYSTILYVLNFLAIGGIVYVGVKYMLAGAEGRANLKSQGAVIVLGIIMAYATITFLNFILKFAGV